jgi:homoserine/homoserine lactone efflux protein
VNTMSNSLTVGFRRSLWGILGQQAALVIHMLIVAAGVGLLVAGSETAFNAIRYAGAAYLVYLGIRLFRAQPDVSEDGITSRRNEPAWSIFRRGFWVNLLNPKAIVFFLAFTPQFIHYEQPLLPQYAVFAATIVGLDILVMWFFFAGTAKSFRRFTHSERGQRQLNRVFGALFIAMGVLLALFH